MGVTIVCYLKLPAQATNDNAPQKSGALSW